MEYKLLTAEQQAQIYRQKAIELEAEHVRLTLDLRLAASAGIENQNVDAAKGQLAILLAQMAALDSWMNAGDTLTDNALDGELVPTGSNGAGG